jgi:hypothetical protein
MSSKHDAVQQDIAELLGENIFRRRLARRIGACDTGRCDGKCGALCPASTTRRFREQLPALRQLFRETSDGRIHRFQLRRSTWKWDEGCLSDASLGAISKTFRRALDSLREPSICAVGTIDARWGGTGWFLGADVIVRAPIEANIVSAFDRNQNLQQVITLPVLDVDADLQQLFEPLQYCKSLLPEEADWDGAPNNIRRDYYRWLAGLKPGSRIVRYGCDRYFNALHKQSHWKPTIKKGRPYPRWLVPYQYGNHPDGCECRICTSRRY